MLGAVFGIFDDHSTDCPLVWHSEKKQEEPEESTSTVLKVNLSALFTKALHTHTEIA